MAKKHKSEKSRTANLTTVNPGIKCPHCGECYHHKVTNTYPGGKRRRICGGCGKPFVDMQGN